MATLAKTRAKIQKENALRLMPSVRIGAERFSASEGVSLNQFINVAIAEKVARLEHQRWASSRKPFDEAARREALELLSLGANIPPDPGDEIPKEYLARWSQRIDADEVRAKLAKASSRA